MIRISTKGRYGTRFMLELAKNYNVKPMLLKDVARSQDISEGYLQHIVDALKGAGLIRSHRVGHGGYTLSREPKNITLYDILNTLEGSVNLVECIDTPEVCERSKNCIMRDVWGSLSKSLSKSLKEITLDDILRMEKEKTANNLVYEI